MKDGASHVSTAHTSHTEGSKAPALGRAGAAEKVPTMRPIPPLRGIGAVLVAAALLLGYAAPAQAEVLVSNMEQKLGANIAEDPSNKKLAQGFTTGSNAAGYELESIEVILYRAPKGGTLTVSVRTKASGGPRNKVLYALTNPYGLDEMPDDSAAKFSAPDNAHLDKETSYFVLMSYDDAGSRQDLARTERPETLPEHRLELSAALRL